MNHKTVRTISFLLVLLMVLAACGESDSTDTSGESPAGANTPGMTEVATDTEDATPTSATQAESTPMTSDEGTESSGTRLIIAAEAEPESLYINVGCSYLADMTQANVYESLTTRNRDGEVVGRLAESFEQIDENTWRFYLREGVKFHNGEDFNADAVVSAIDQYMNPDAASRCGGTWASIQWPAEKVDDYTVDIKTSVPDPLIPTRILRLWITAPEWAASTSEEEQSVTAVGTGPYRLVEWDRGSHLLFERFEDYWGEAPEIAEVQILGRCEASVRASMLQAEEAHIAHMMPPDLVDQVPNAVVNETMEAIGIRLNMRHPVLEDVRVRQAIAFAIDVDSIVDAFFPGFAEPLNGQMDRPAARGHNPDLEPYPYDPDRARELIQEAGAEGETIEMIVRSGGFPMATEVGEAITNMISDIGITAVPVNLEADLWREQLFAVGVDQQRPDMLVTGATNNVFDSSRTLEAYYGEEGTRFSMLNDEEIANRILEAGQLSGDERELAYQEIWADVYDLYYFVPLFGLDFVHGMADGINWEPRNDEFVFFSDISFGE